MTNNQDKYFDIWSKNGCPEKMIIHVFGSKEDITLIDGSPVTLTRQNNALSMRGSEGEKEGSVLQVDVTLTKACEVCTTRFIPKRKSAKFCNPRCRKAAQRKRIEDKKKIDADELVKRVYELGLGKESE